MIPKIEPQPRAGKRYADLIQLMRISERITERGWRVDRDKLQLHRANAARRVLEFTEMFLTKSGLPVGALGASGSGATNHVRDWFWVDQRAPQLVFNKLTKKPQFSTELLISYAQDFRKEVFGGAAAALYGLRKNKKIIEFVDTYLRFSAHDGRIHFSFNCAGTQTGRWTSSTKMRLCHEDGSRSTVSCNAQQVPKKTPSFDFEDGRGPVRLVEGLRDCFLADEGCVLLSCDYEALEARLIAYVYGAKKLISWIETGADIHINNAVAIFKELRLPVDAKQVKPATTDLQRLINSARDAAKPLAYGVSYQMHDPDGHGRYVTLFKTLKKIFPTMTEQLANIYASRFFDLHPEIREGQLRVRQSIEKLGLARLSIDGRCLHYPATPRGFNQALNFHMQATGAALLNRATIALDKRLDWQGQEIRAQVHDELVVQAPLSSMAEVKGWLEEEMGAPAQIGETMAGVPATADPGLDWGSTMPFDKFMERRPWSLETSP